MSKVKTLSTSLIPRPFIFNKWPGYEASLLHDMELYLYCCDNLILDMYDTMHTQWLKPGPSLVPSSLRAWLGSHMTSHDLPVHQSIFEQGCHSVDIILSHLPNVFKEKGERLEDTILDVQLRHTILIHEGGEDSKRGAGFSNNGNGNCGAHSHLSLLHLEVVQERCQYILWPMMGGRKCVE